MVSGSGIVPMIATGLGLGQVSVKISGCKRVNRRARLPGAHLDAVMVQIIKGALPDIGDNDHLDALLAQPARERTRFVRRCSDDLRADNDPVLPVRFHQCKLFGFPQMANQAAIRRRDGDFQVHGLAVAG